MTYSRESKRRPKPAFDATTSVTSVTSQTASVHLSIGPNTFSANKPTARTSLADVFGMSAAGARMHARAQSRAGAPAPVVATTAAPAVAVPRMPVTPAPAPAAPASSTEACSSPPPVLPKPPVPPALRSSNVQAGPRASPATTNGAIGASTAVGQVAPPLPPVAAAATPGDPGLAADELLVAAAKRRTAKVEKRLQFLGDCIAETSKEASMVLMSLPIPPDEVPSEVSMHTVGVVCALVVQPLLVVTGIAECRSSCGTWSE